MRPEGWEEQKWKDIPYNSPMISGEEVANVYEAGADAMLEGLKTDGQRIDADGIKSISIPVMGSAHGWFVFIEE